MSIGTGGEVDYRALDTGVEALRGRNDWSSGVVVGLRDVIVSGTDLDLFRVNPIRYAASHSVAESESVDLFLNAAHIGLFDMEWNIVCGSCGNVFKSFRHLDRLDPDFQCNLCNMNNRANLDDLIHVVFTVSPAVREIAFHDPERLSIERLLFEFKYSRDLGPQFGDLTVVEALRDWTCVLRYLEPGERVSVNAELSSGSLVLRDLRSDSLVFMAGGTGSPSSEPIDVTLDAAGFAHPGLAVSQATVPGIIGTWEFPKVHRVRDGRLHIRCTNASGEKQALWAVRYPPMDLAAADLVSFEPFLSAKQLLHSPTFRKLFRAEAPKEGEGLSVDDLTYLFTDLKSSTLMYDRVGDATAYNLVRAHFDVIGEAVTSNRGIVVKTIGDAVMATFTRAVDAVSAALAMRERLTEVTTPSSAELSLKIGIHTGRSIAVTLNERLDYFGQNVNIAARTQQLAAGNEILITEDVLSSPGVADRLDDFALQPVPERLRGVGDDIRVLAISS